MFYTSPSQANLLMQFQDMTAYHAWAVGRLVEWLKTKPSAVLESDAASSFPGIKATLLHIWDVERHWLAHMQGRPAPSLLAGDFDGCMLEALEGWQEHADMLNDYVQSLSMEELGEDCVCNVMFVGEICRPRVEMLQHCLNHGTYHRGQVVSIGHQVGLKDAPMTDYMYYVLRVKKTETAATASRNRWRREQAASFVHENLLAVNFFSK